MGKGKRIRAERAARRPVRRPVRDPEAEARALMGDVWRHRFTRPPWEAWRELERRHPGPELEMFRRGMEMIPFAVRKMDHGPAPSGSGSLAFLAAEAGLPMEEMVAALELAASAGAVRWAQSSHTVYMTVPVPA